MSNKDYKRIYIFIYIYLVICIITKGFNIEIAIDSKSENVNRNYGAFEIGTSDGFNYKSSLLVVNPIVGIVTFIISFIATVKKNNKIKYKNYIFLGTIILIFLLPIFKLNISGGVAGVNKDYGITVLQLVLTRQ